MVKKILAVDDEEVICRQIKLFLERNKGVEVITAENADDALAVVSETKDIDLFIFDLWMPGKNGLELAKEIKQDEAFKDVPMIACTAFADQSFISHWEEFFSLIMEKPFDVQDFNETVLRLLNE